MEEFFFFGGKKLNYHWTNEKNTKVYKKQIQKKKESKANYKKGLQSQRARLRP